ncbi:Cation-transporting ATPase [Methanosarcina siciliae HI350]|uniref:P-type Cu(+) transporter n=1 Tax=Methanosarcina siciliae HI350 TaxID=1434119 RepID=A0A0E3LAK4_9EURY|nr:HAD-IC family P-type ATPase [Methanosarcina siciliae]AKB32176.1 Cation-transporting ATPase [Methanosarcina siciliae HI350]
MILSDPGGTKEGIKQQDLEKKMGNGPYRKESSELVVSESQDKDTVKWHSQENEKIFRELETSSRGLDPEEAAIRLKEYGENTLPTKKPPKLAEIVLHQFKSPLIYILLIAGIIAVFMDDLRDAGFIFLVVIINAVIGTIQEWKAEQSASQLQTILKIMSRIRRRGVESEIPAEEIVPGDIVLLESGSRIPADLRILRATNLTVDESLLTGESAAVQKTVGVLKEDTPVSDRHNMTYAGSTVITGRGCGVATATGSRTEVGRIARAVTETESAKPPLLIRMEDFSRRIGIFVIFASVVMSAVALSQGTAPVEVFFLAVALVVSAIPEGLPVGVTVALSIASTRMAKRNVIVRKLSAVESLGSCTTIATDKTGTLTVNQQTARMVLLPPGNYFEILGEGYIPEGEVKKKDGGFPDAEEMKRLQKFALATAICNEGTLYEENGKWVNHGDSIDVAFLALASKIGINPKEATKEVKIIAEVPFESERMYAAVYYQEDRSEPVRLAVKGAMEAVLPYCTAMNTSEGSVPINPDALNQGLNFLMEEGYRALVVAEGQISGEVGEAPELESVKPELTFLGIAAFIDPLRPDVTEAVHTCKRAGIDVIMITGDHPKTAYAIARELDITHSIEEMITGREMEKLGDPELPVFISTLEKVRVFARVTPIQKMQIVDSLVRRGHFVAVTGDGVNDAPALQRANIGVAMGSGTDVAKDTSSMIVTDDTFSSIVAGAEEGRIAYDNIRKVTLLLISTGLAEVILFILALFAGLPVPLLAVQLLWLNLVTNGIQGVAMAFEAGEPGTMLRKPRKPEEGIFNKLMIEQTLISGVTVGVVAFAVWLWLTGEGYEEDHARNFLLLLMILFENCHVFNCRSEYRSAFRVPIRNNYFLIAGVIIMQGLHIVSMHIPFMQELLDLNPVSFESWFSLFLIASIVVVVMEIFKKVNYHSAKD